MKRHLSILVTTALLVIGGGGLLAHEKYRMVGVVTKRQATEIHIKTKEGTAFTVYLVDKTVYQREKKKVAKAELKLGQTVVVDALGHGDEDLEAQVINIVPPIKSETPPKPRH